MSDLVPHQIPQYPKIETLFTRDPETFKVTDHLRRPEFDLVKRWLVTEKIDGTNIRVKYPGLQGDRVLFGGRTDRAQVPPQLLEHLQETFPIKAFRAQFDGPVILFGEGYGPKIQKGGGGYRDTPGFRLFDVLVGHWWLNWDSVVEVAVALGIRTVPLLHRSAVDLPTVLKLVSGEAPLSSWVARFEGGDPQHPAEGVVCRTEPLLLQRNGKRLMFKLKTKDFSQAEVPGGDT